MSARLLRWGCIGVVPIEFGAAKNFNQSSLHPQNAYAGFRIHADGTMDGTQANILNWAINAGTWLVAGLAADYEFRATVTSGETPLGSAVDTWISATLSPNWYHEVLGLVDTDTCTLLIEGRRVGTVDVLDSVTVGLMADVEPDA